jgi:hypothetical protein
MMELGSLIKYPLWWFFRECPGMVLLFTAFALVLPLLSWRSQTGKCNTASLLLMLSLPIPIAGYFIVNRFRWQLDIICEPMRLGELADLGTMFCFVLLLGILSVLPGFVLALALLLRRSLPSEEKS